jgi:structural maintenance of chromosome 4
LSTADIQEENLPTPPPAMDKLSTPAPSTRSVSPVVGKIDPATPVKPEPESPKETTSDKENQVPLLAVPSLLGSVKKGQERTPPPEYISPRKLGIAQLTAMENTVPEGPRNRIVITHLVLNNFKSYAGRQIIGPFHTVHSLFGCC